MGLVLALVVFSVAIWLKNHNYLGEANLINIGQSSVDIFIIGIVSTMVFVGGGLDLSVGSVYALGSVSCAMALTNGVPVVLSILIGLGAGAVAGLVNGIIIEYLGIPPLITTLGSLYVVEGIVIVLTGGNAIFPLPASFNAIGEDSIGPVPYLVVYAVVLGIIGHIVLEYTRFGYRIRATGGNRAAARAMGIRVKRLSVTVYVLSGISAALAGVLFASQLASGQPSIGSQTELLVIAAVIIGGTSLFGGTGTIIGTVLGCLLLEVITDGLVMININPAYQDIAIGAVIVIAVGIDRLQRGRQWRISAVEAVEAVESVGLADDEAT
jgi:ribose/xylose/arabinose/galactoside ABC-type transport system permease subunit